MSIRPIKPQHETCTRILDAAEELFMQHGFEGTSMRHLTSRAGVNLAAVNYHFGSKDRLVEEVFHRGFDPLGHRPVDGLGRSTKARPAQQVQEREQRRGFSPAWCHGPSG